MVSGAEYVASLHRLSRQKVATLKKYTGGTGVVGGMNPSSVNGENTEGRVFKQTDGLDDVLKQFIAEDIGAYITNKMFLIPNPLTRDSDITFDRFYPRKNLLTHAFSRHRTYTNLEDPEFDVDVKRMRDYAEENGFLFLAVVDGEVERDDLIRLHAEAVAH